MNDNELLMGHTEEELRAAFALVKPAGNWKMPVDAVIPAGTDHRLIEDAILFYTGGMAEFQRQGESWRVTAPGYYHCIGS